MSRLGDDYYEDFPNQWLLQEANLDRSLKGKKGQKALRELRDALLALPEKRLVQGALSTAALAVDLDRGAHPDPWGYERARIEQEGEGVCAVGAFAAYCKARSEGISIEDAMRSLPALTDDAPESGVDTVDVAARCGMPRPIAWQVQWLNEGTEFRVSSTAEERYQRVLKWVEKRIHG